MTICGKSSCSMEEGKWPGELTYTCSIETTDAEKTLY
jgi:hypothetical protein